MRKRLVYLVISMLMFLVSCDDLSENEYGFKKKSKEAIKEESNTERSGNIAYSMNEEKDELLADGEAVLKIAFVTNELLSEYNSYIKFYDDKKGDEWIIIPYIKIRDFQWIEVVQTMTEGVLGVQYSIKDVLFSAGELLPGTPFIVVYTDRSSIPFRAISFIDENNERRQFLVFENLRSPEDRLGSFVFYEYKMNSNNTEINDNLCGEQEEE